MKSIILLIALFLTTSMSAKTLTDLDGKKVTLPDVTDRVFGSSPPMNYLLYTLNPEKMIGLNFAAKNSNNSADEKFLNQKFLSLPVIGSFHGGGQSINLETLMTYKPQLVLVWQDDMLVQTVAREIEKTKIPTFMIPFREVNDMPNAFRLAGNAIGENKRGEVLAIYSQGIISEVHNSVSKLKPVRYYYAEGMDGLSTECDKSFHVEAMNFAGGENVHKCQQSGILGLEKISFETLLTYNPDVIIVQNSSVFFDLKNDPMWKNLRAVKSGHIHLVPVQPFNWIDRPPSFMRVLGIQWLAHLFHPKEYKVDLLKRTKEFYDLFLHVKLSDEQTKNLVGDK
ncbi:MAG: ABC transporter substrate-binding protein [Sulfuricurvum sp.]|uniref:ABC transporter substrate-binding protein n=1 Tax=Sulfuricurvum sp. TaxID=2025608 RepID=UPI00263A1141|nr:ABC transporter substrate-binding protein [Sulfuricurvum sp.]MDD2830233.1 ABC transporter substrate-binding protein [Sulfuricurvum sp.]MDD4948809.1 ABC transporter substrate-binding protein [Sulfuricurvum sp.]